jgi:hypothetical protein
MHPPELPWEVGGCTARVAGASRSMRVKISFEVTTLHITVPLTLALNGNATIFPIAMAVKLSSEVSRCNGRYRHTWSSRRVSSRWHMCC